MVAHGRVELLAHPLSQKYLQMKWNSYGKYFHLANLLIYCIFLAFVTIFAAQLMDDNTMTSTPTKDVNSTYNGSHNVASPEVLMLYTIFSSSNIVTIEIWRFIQSMVWNWVKNIIVSILNKILCSKVLSLYYIELDFIFGFLKLCYE